MTKHEKIKVLHILTAMDASGVPSLLYSYFSNMRCSDVVFDFVAILDDDRTYANKFINDYGSKVYYMPKPYLKRFSYLLRLIKSGNYNIIHSHIELASAIYLFIALIAGVKVRIAHAHMAFKDYEHGFVNKMLRSLLNSIATERIGCSKDANICLFGEKAGKDLTIMRNAIDVRKFSFNQNLRIKYREDMELNGKTVVGFVGRLSPQKNIYFMLSVFEAYHKKNPNAILLVVGMGELYNEFRTEIKKRKLMQVVIMTGARTDIPQLMMAMDIMLVTSLFEGLGIVLIEAQAASLPVLASRYTIPYTDTNISDYIEYVSLEERPETWADKIRTNIKRKPIPNIIKSAGYDIEQEAQHLTILYKQTLTRS